MKIENFIYFDTYATLPCSKANNKFVLQYMNCFNPSNIYACKEKKLVENFINKIMKIFKCKEKNIILTSGGSESNSTIIYNKGIFNTKGKNIVICNLDHPSILNKALELSNYGIKFRIYKANNGLYEINNLMSLIDKSTCLVVLTYAFSEVGNNNNTELIAKQIKEKYPGIHIHLDYVQGFYKHEEFIDLSIFDSIAISFHKIGAMKGSGLLLIKDDRIVPLISGKQNHNLRGGTIAIELLASDYYAMLENEEMDNYIKNFGNLFPYLFNQIKQFGEDYLIYTSETTPVGNCLVVGFKNAKNKDIQSELLKYKIIIGTGSACSTKSLERNVHLFESFGENSKNYSPIRISWSKKTTKNDMDILLSELFSIIKKLRK